MNRGRTMITTGVLAAVIGLCSAPWTHAFWMAGAQGVGAFDQLGVSADMDELPAVPAVGAAMKGPEADPSPVEQRAVNKALAIEPDMLPSCDPMLPACAEHPYHKRAVLTLSRLKSHAELVSDSEFAWERCDDARRRLHRDDMAEVSMLKYMEQILNNYKAAAPLEKEINGLLDQMMAVPSQERVLPVEVRKELRSALVRFFTKDVPRMAELRSKVEFLVAHWPKSEVPDPLRPYDPWRSGR